MPSVSIVSTSLYEQHLRMAHSLPPPSVGHVLWSRHGLPDEVHVDEPRSYQLLAFGQRTPPWLRIDIYEAVMWLRSLWFMVESPIDARGSCREVGVEAVVFRNTKRRQLSDVIQPSGW